MVWPSAVQKAGTTMLMMTTNGWSSQRQQTTQPKTARWKISLRTDSSTCVAEVQKKFWAEVHRPFLDHHSRWKVATLLQTTNIASKRFGGTFIVNKELVVKFQSGQNTIASTENSENSNTKQNKNTFVRFAKKWKKRWKFMMWENSTNSFQNLVYSWKVFSRRGLEPHSLQQITTYLTQLGSNPPIVTDATIEEGLPQLPSDHTLDMVPHDAEILHELSRMKNSAPGEDEVNSSMYKSLSPLGKRVLCQRLRDLWTSPTHTWSSSLHGTLGFRAHKKGCRHDLGNYRTLWLISVIVRLLCRILASRVSRYCEFHHLLPNTQWGFRANHSTQGPAMLLRCIAEQANAIGTRPENAPDRVAALFPDIEKAYPSVPTDAAEKLFLRVGLPPVFVKLLVGGPQKCEIQSEN